MSKLYRYLKIIVKQHLKKLLLIVFFLTISTLLNIVMPIINKKIMNDLVIKTDIFYALFKLCGELHITGTLCFYSHSKKTLST